MLKHFARSRILISKGRDQLPVPFSVHQMNTDKVAQSLPDWTRVVIRVHGSGDGCQILYVVSLLGSSNNTTKQSQVVALGCLQSDQLLLALLEYSLGEAMINLAPREDGTAKGIVNRGGHAIIHGPRQEERGLKEEGLAVEDLR